MPTQTERIAAGRVPNRERATKRAEIRRTWQLQDAKNQLSEVVRRTAIEGPQTITLHGRPAVVVLSFADYRRLSKPNQPLVEFLSNLPMKGLRLDLARDKTPARETEL